MAPADGALFVLFQYRRARHYLTWQQREERKKGSLSPMCTFTITVHREDYDFMYRAIAEAPWDDSGEDEAALRTTD